MNQTDKRKLNRHLKILTFVVVFMFGFGFAQVPLYNTLCKVAGLNGKTQTNDIILPNIPIDTSRYITVELVSTTNDGAPAVFYPQTKKFKIHPGEFIDTAFWVENLSEEPLTIQAVPSVAPGLAASHVKKQVCFCFQHQDLDGKQTMKMPLRFTVHPDLPQKYSTVTLAYTLFDVT